MVLCSSGELCGPCCTLRVCGMCCAPHVWNMCVRSPPCISGGPEGAGHADGGCERRDTLGTGWVGGGQHTWEEVGHFGAGGLCIGSHWSVLVGHVGVA